MRGKGLSFKALTSSLDSEGSANVLLIYFLKGVKNSNGKAKVRTYQTPR